MATTLERIKTSVNVGTIVNNAIASVKAVRLTEQSRKEAEFQKAVAGGMSYADQVSFREKQLEDEMKSSFSDAEYIKQLEVDIANTKKLSRFEKIRNKYKQSLDDYVGGKASNAQHISLLEDLMTTEKDPKMQEEIRGLLSTARKEQATIEMNAIKNRALVASKDKSLPLLDSSISEIQSRRSLAAINQNEDEVAMWDDTLLALRGAKSKLQIENGLNEITFQTNRKNLKSNEKLGLLNDYVNSSDMASPVVYNGVSYPSLKAYWENKRGEYIANNYFDDVKTELEEQTATIAATSVYGQVPVSRIDAVSRFYTDLATRPEFAPYAAKIEQQRVDTVNSLVTNLAESIYSEAESTRDTVKAQKAIQAIESKFGVKVSREAFASEPVNVAGTVTRETAAIKKPETKVEAAPTAPETPPVKPISEVDTSAFTPTQKAAFEAAKTQVPESAAQPVAVAPQTPESTPPATAVQPKVYVVKAGDTLSAIAQKQLGDASRAFDLKTDTGEVFDEVKAKRLQVGTKLIIPQ